MLREIIAKELKKSLVTKRLLVHDIGPWASSFYLGFELTLKRYDILELVVMKFKESN